MKLADKTLSGHIKVKKIMKRINLAYTNTVYFITKRRITDIITNDLLFFDIENNLNNVEAYKQFTGIAQKSTLQNFKFFIYIIHNFMEMKMYPRLIQNNVRWNKNIIVTNTLIEFINASYIFIRGIQLQMPFHIAQLVI